MHSTGIVRRVDDFGKIAIPKEIRRSLRIKEGEAMEFYTDKDGSLTMKKYYPENLDIQELCDKLCQNEPPSKAMQIREKCDELKRIVGEV